MHKTQWEPSSSAAHLPPPATAATATAESGGFKMPASIAQVMSTRVERVKVVVAVHFLLTSCALMGAFLPAAYSYYNTVLLLALVWSIHCRESIDAVHASLAVDGISVLFDLICIIGWFASYSNVFSIVFAIFNLAARPFSLIILHRELLDRGGSLSFGSVYPAGVGGADGRRPTAYEDIDRVPTQSIPTNMA